METAPSKTKLVTDIEAEWGLLEKTLNRLSEAQMLAPGVTGEWSVKDLLAHIILWEKVMLDRVEGALTGEPLKYPPITNDEDVNLVNSHAFIDNRERPLSDVQAEFRDLYEHMHSVLEALSEEDLTRPVPWDWASDDLRLWHIIIANTTDHYQEHRLEIEKAYGQ
jgi:hypothetical protein